MHRRGYDIIIVGGGVIGSSIACHLANDGVDAAVAVFEKDTTYEFASTSRSLGGIRQQFSTHINIQIGLYSVQAFERFDEEMQVDGEPACASYHPCGYLFLGDKENWGTLQKQYELQRSLGVDVELLSCEQVKRKIPHLSDGAFCGAVLGRRAGYVDPNGVLQGYSRKARALGVDYIQAEVSEILREENRLVGVRTSKGDFVEGKIVVIAAGPWAADVGRMAGVALPIEPSPKMAFHFDPAEKFGYELPFVFGPRGHWFRHEAGRQIFAGKDRLLEPGFRFEWDPRYFEDELWPALAHLVPSFESLRLNRGWGGLYEVNKRDHNALIGAYPEVEGLYVAVGFSGHGVMQSPAVGKGMSELIRTGKYETVDLSPLGVERLHTGRLVIEEAVF
jgi:FAD-dependent oxidoreductase domain-containing protein 1